MRIAIVDYGMGNLASVIKACISFGAEVKITQNPEEMEAIDKIILPGVGAFGDAAAQLKKIGLADAIKSKIKQGMPFLGICLGMHLLFDKSQESPRQNGLGVIGGKVIRFEGKDIKVPHIGWNQIEAKNSKSPLLETIENNAYVYFCHSYYVKPDGEDVIAATTDYGVKFASIISKDNIFGIQFHPEKSQKTGLAILENFIKL